MKKEFLKIAGVEKESDFYKLFPTEEAFFGMYPEAKKLVQKNKDKLTKANIGLTTFETTRPPIYTNDRRKAQSYNDSLRLYNLYRQGHLTSISQGGRPSFIQKGVYPEKYEEVIYETSPNNFVSEKVLNPYWHSNIKPIGLQHYTLRTNPDNRRNVKIDGEHVDTFNESSYQNFIYKEPVQPIVYQEQPDLKMVGAERTNLAPSFTINQPPKLSYIARPENKYLVSYIDEDGVGREEYFPTSQAADDYMNWRRANNMFYGTSMSRRGVYEEGGQLPKAQVGKEIPNDVNLANQKKQQLLNWYQGRMNHPDPRISAEAKQVLENMNNNYSESFPSSAIQYKPLEQFIVASKYGSYDPRQHKVQLTNPNISFNDEISKARYLPKKLIKSNREEYENMYNTSLSDEVRGHELLHYFLEKSAMPVIGTKHNKNIYSGYTDPDTYTNLLYEREGKPDLKGRDKLGFTQGAKGAYTWLTGTANTDLSPLPFKKPNPKKMFNQEMYRALMDFRNEFQIDPSKNTTPEDFKNIYQKIQENYQKAIKEKDNNKTLRYEHFLDLFNIHGNDFEKLNNLNNLLVGRSSLKQPMARDGFSVTDTTTKPAGFLDYLKTAASAVFNTPYAAASTISDQVEKSPFLSNPVVNFVDFTGTTNYPNLKQAVRDFKNAKGFWPTLGTGALLGLEGLSSFPVIAPEARIAKQGVKGTKNVIKKITRKILTPVKGTDRITNKILPVQSLMPVSNFSRLATGFNRGGRAFRGAESLFDTFVNKLESSAAYSGEKVKLRMPDGTILVLNTDDPKYEQLYNSGKLGSWNSVDSSFNIIK